MDALCAQAALDRANGIEDRLEVALDARSGRADVVAETITATATATGRIVPLPRALGVGEHADPATGGYGSARVGSSPCAG